jgi:hypothetical protein
MYCGTVCKNENSPCLLLGKIKLNMWMTDDIYIRIAIVPSSNNNKMKFNKDKFQVDFSTKDKIIYGEKYNLYSLKTLSKFNLQITSRYIDSVSYSGHIDVLEWWKNSGLPLEYSEYAVIDCLHIHILEWWKDSGLPLKYDEHVLDRASKYGKIDVLEWWKNSGLELKYDACISYSLHEASKCGQVAVLEWWKNSGLPFKCHYWSLQVASENGQVAVLEWWKNSGLELIYDEYAISHASKYGHINVLEWWKNSGLEIKYCQNLSYYVSFGGPVVLEWWKNYGLNFEKKR